MNAPCTSIRHTTLPTMLAASIALVFALSLPVHAQSSYPASTGAAEGNPAASGKPVPPSAQSNQPCSYGGPCGTQTRAPIVKYAGSYTQAAQNTPVRRPMQPIAQGAYPVATQPGASPTNPGTSTSGTAAMPQSGPFYTLTLTATQINGHAAGPGHVMTNSVSVGWSGATISISGGNLALQGQVANNHLTATSQSADGTQLSLSGTPAAHSANGTFTLAEADGHTASGGFSLTASNQQHTLKKIKAYGGTTPAPPSTTWHDWWAAFKEWF